MDYFALSILGYNRKEVNTKFEEYQSSLSKLESELENLKKEHTTVAAELERYRDMEAALKKGIVDARLAGTKIIEESNERANAMMEETHSQIQEYKSDISQRSRQLVDSGMDVKKQLKTMKQEFQAILDSYQEKLDQTDFDALYPKKNLDRLLVDLENYEMSGDLLEGLSLHAEDLPMEDRPVRKQPISEEEKEELEKLIQEVITNEAENVDLSNDKLVDFSKIMNS